MIGELHIFVQDISSALSSSPCWAPWLWQLAWAEPCSSTASSYRTRGQCDSAVLSSQPPTFSVSARRPGPLLTTFLAGSSRGFSLSQPSRSSQSPGWTIWMSNDLKYILPPGTWDGIENFRWSIECLSLLKGLEKCKFIVLKSVVEVVFMHWLHWLHLLMACSNSI